MKAYRYRNRCLFAAVVLVNFVPVHPLNDNNNNSHRLHTTKQHDRRRKTTRRVARSDHLVKGGALPLLNSSSFPTKHYAGHIQIPSSEQRERNLFYWLFAPALADNDNDIRSDDDEIPLVIWLNGGPGTSSLVGLFLEHGPFRFVPNPSSTPVETDILKLEINHHSWHMAPAWMLYVDQPVGTGLSFVRNGNGLDDLCDSDECIATDFYAFLREFLWLHRESMLKHKPNQDGSYLLRRKLFFAGESYAGRYIPIIVDHIIRQNGDLCYDNNNNDDEDPPPIHIPVAGIAIGNGYMDPRTQYNNAEALLGHGFIDRSQKTHFDQMEAKCVKMLDVAEAENLPLDDPADCFWDNFDSFSITSSKKGDYSDYDSRIWLPEGEEYPPGRSMMEAYLGNREKKEQIRMDVDPLAVLNAIHATGFAEEERQFKMTSHNVGEALGDLDIIPVTNEVVHILNANVKVMFYNGVMDLMCDHIGNEKFLERLPWSRKADWAKTKRFAWMPSIAGMDKKPRGFAKEFDNLSFLKLLDAGHLLPMDIPEVSLVMLREFLKGNKFRGSKQPLGQAKPDENCNTGLEEEVANEASADKETLTGDDEHKIIETEQKKNDCVFHPGADQNVDVLWLIASAILLASLSFWVGRWSIRQHKVEYSSTSLEDDGDAQMV